MQRRKPYVETLLDSATTNVSSEAKAPWCGPYTYQATGVTSAGSGAATIIIEVSNVGGADTNWITMGTIALTLGTAVTTDGFASNAPWKYVRARISSISGTNATVSVLMTGLGA